MDDIQASFKRSTVGPADADPLSIPDVPALAFGGFGREAFAILERLRTYPHIDQYRKEKPGLRAHLQEPFKTYRDDLVVNLVLPNRLNVETERNVFSRLLKNDFGAGGCHHHIWLSFYRPGRTRLSDIQLAHSLRPAGLRIAVIARKQARDTFQRACHAVFQEPSQFRALVNSLLQTREYVLAAQRGRKDRVVWTEPIDRVPEGIGRVDSFGLFRTIPAEDVVAKGGRIMPTVLRTVAALWPLYQFLLR